MTPLRRFLSRINARRPADEPRTAPQEQPIEQPQPSRSRARASEPDAAGQARRSRSSEKADAKPASRSSSQTSNKASSNKTASTRTATNSASTSKSRSGSKTASKPSGGTRSKPKAAEKNGGEEARTYSWGRVAGDDEDTRKELERRRADMLRRRRGYRPPRDRLDAPLPEDVAFRAADEGGDRTILPARRRKPKGLRTTERVIYAGSRFLGFARKPLEPSNGTAEARAAEEAQAEEEEVEDLEAVRLEAEDADRIAVAEIAAAQKRETPIAPEPTETTTAAPDIDTEAGAEAETETEAAHENGTTEARRPRRRGRRGGRGRSRTRADDGVEQEAEAPESPEHAVPAEQAAAPRAAVAAAPVSPEQYPEAFRALGLDDRTLGVMASFGFDQPTPIQERSIPVLLEGRDVVGLAQTGSGKTVAFGIPMVERLDASSPEVQAVVLVPTRELAQQVLDVLEALAEPYGLTAIGLLGGRALKGDFRALESRPHIVVGTPGRIIDHLRRKSLSLRHVTYAVLDEADQMLDIGFLPDIRRILSHTPEARQTALFSATMPTTIKRLVWQFMRDPETVSVDEELSTVESTEQVYFEVAQRDKVRGLRELIERELKGRTLVFCKMKRGVDRLARDLNGMGVRVGALHGDMDQRKRDAVVRDFRNGKLDVLVATNVAARGLDIPEITHVVNYDAPQNAEEYVHRIGRTGRAGREGKAITFICEHDLDELEMLQEHFGDDLKRERLELYA